MRYEEFVAGKQFSVPPCGFEPREIAEPLFEFQRAIVAWACKRGRAAIFADTGLGKTRMELAIGRQVHEHTGGNVLLVAPLAVAAQTVREGETIGVAVRYCRSQSEVRAGITITNYDMLHAFDLSQFVCVMLDESSILKAYDGKTRTAIIEACRETPYRFAFTATPAPNDHTELGNHAEFLGIMTRTEMLATFFCHDGGETQTWRLKGHAEDLFWRWCATWGVAVRRPSDLGFDDAGYELPPLDIETHTVTVDDRDAFKGGHLFAMQALTLNDQRAAKRASLDKRVARVAEIVAREPGEQWLVWCDLNDESTALAKAIPGAVEITGSDDPETKAQRMLAFTDRTIRVLVTKGSIAGFGMNWQNCARQAFVGVTHSYETFYQSVRRSWRFGQTRAVNVHVVASDLETSVVASLRRKEADAARMNAAMVAAMRETQIANVRASERETVEYEPRVAMVIPQWLRSEAA